MNSPKHLDNPRIFLDGGSSNKNKPSALFSCSTHTHWVPKNFWPCLWSWQRGWNLQRTWEAACWRCSGRTPWLWCWSPPRRPAGSTQNCSAKQLTTHKTVISCRVPRLCRRGNTLYGRSGWFYAGWPPPPPGEAGTSEIHCCHRQSKHVDMKTWREATMKAGRVALLAVGWILAHQEHLKATPYRRALCSLCMQSPKRGCCFLDWRNRWMWGNKMLLGGNRPVHNQSSSHPFSSLYLEWHRTKSGHRGPL